MIAMGVDGPLRENHIGLFSIQESTALVIVRVINYGAAIRLAEERGARFQDLTCFRSFPGTHGSALRCIGPLAEPFSAIQVQYDDVVAKTGVSRDGSTASALRITRMPARNNNLQPS